MAAQQTQDTPPPSDPDLARLDFVASLMDNAFRVPGTSFRFGFDSILGLVPGVGDGIGLLVSGFLATIMVRRGAGPVVMLQMLGNMGLDAVVGAVPLAGDIFDFGFKANRRNVALLKKYYASGDRKPHAGWSVALLVLLFLGLLGLLFWGIWRLSAMLVQGVVGWFG